MTGRENMKQRMGLAAAALGTLFAIAPLALAQQPAANVHGHVTNPAGAPVVSGQVKFTKDLTAAFKDEKFTTTVEIDKDGNYTAPGVAPGEYFIYVMQGDKALDRMQVVLKASDDKTVDFDMTRAEYLAKLTPEEKKAIEEYKAKTAATTSANKVVANLNTTMTAVRADMKSATPNFDKDLADMKQATDARPAEGLLWVVTGEVYSAKADAAAKADRANKTSPTTDDAVMKGYSDSVDNFKKGVDLMAAAKTPNPEQEATVYNQMGSTLSHAGKSTDAVAAFDKAVSLQPKSAGMFYSNEAAVLFNAHQDDAALQAADKAITADPTKPEPYYVKGQELLAKATLDQKTQKIIPPAGCVDAYQKYLELAPDGPQAANVKEVLASLGEKVSTHYKASTAKK